MRVIARGAVIVLALVTWWLLFAPTQIGGPLGLAIVHGHSMAPTLQDSDLVVTYRTPDYHVGDTVLYEQFGGLVLHTIVAGNEATGWITRGDNNAYDDPWIVESPSVHGRVLFSSPSLGAFFSGLAEHPGVLPSVALGLFIVFALPWKRPDGVTLLAFTMVLVPMGAVTALQMTGRAFTVAWWISLAAVTVTCALAGVLTTQRDFADRSSGQQILMRTPSFLKRIHISHLWDQLASAHHRDEFGQGMHDHADGVHLHAVDEPKTHDAARSVHQ